MPRTLRALAALALALPAAPATAQTHFTFRDVGKELGLLPHVGGIAGHAAAWGDIDGSGYPSLYVGTFGGKPYDSKNNMLFRNVKGRFVLDEQKPLQLSVGEQTDLAAGVSRNHAHHEGEEGVSRLRLSARAAPRER